MSRVKITLPDRFTFFTKIPVRITDINFGGHVGNDNVLSLIHEARVQFLHHFHLTELNFSGTSLIMTDVSIEYKAQSFYGDILKVYVTATEFSRVGFTLYYSLTKEKESKETTVALAKTGMICFDYSNKKVTSLPTGIKELLEG